MKRDERAFALGRRTRKGTTLILLRRQERPAMPGPWTVRAIISARTPQRRP